MPCAFHISSVCKFAQLFYTEDLKMSQHLITVIPELDNASIRRTPDSRCSVFDLIAIVGQQSNPRQVWKRLKEQYPEVVTLCDNFQFPGRGQRGTPVTNREGWAYILGLLPGVMGRKYREAAASLVIRYLEADITLAADVVDRNDNQQDLEWLETRVRGKLTRRRLTGVLKHHGVHGNGYAICTNQTYIGLFGTTAKGIRKRKGLPEKANWRDHADVSELNQIAFTEDLSGKRVNRKKAQGNNECASVCYDVAKKVADFERDILSA
jgi:hypothetical protein